MIFSLASKLGTHTPYLVSVAICSKENKSEQRKVPKQALACLISIILSIFLHFVIDYWTSLS
jgi:hypothetical protein